MQLDILASVELMLCLLELGGVLSLCLVVEWLNKMGLHEVLEDDDDLFLLGDLELLQLSG